jgi:hypothetical protein
VIRFNNTKNRRKHMERKIYGVNETYGSYTESLNGSPQMGAPLTDGPPMVAFGPTRQLPRPNTHQMRRRHSVQIPNLADVDISREAVQQLRGLYDTANRNAMQGVPLDQRHVSIVAQGYIGPDNRLMIDGFNVHRHLTDTQRTAVQGSRWGSGLLSLMGAIIGGVLYTQDHSAGAYGAWAASLISLWPVIETQIINRFCKEPDFILRDRDFDPAPERQYQV